MDFIVHKVLRNSINEYNIHFNRSYRLINGFVILFEINSYYLTSYITQNILLYFITLINYISLFYLIKNEKFNLLFLIFNWWIKVLFINLRFIWYCLISNLLIIDVILMVGGTWVSDSISSGSNYNSCVWLQ